MAKLLALFPGQGAQVVGMSKALADASPAAREVFRKADEVLGFSLSRTCFEGPQEALNQTDTSQPAIYVHSCAVLAACAERGKPLQAHAAAGLSLGEYTAVHFAGGFSFEDGLRLVRRRGELMQKACDLVPGAMATVLGLDAEKLAQAVKEGSSKGVIVLANFLAAGQIAISGATAAVAAACVHAKELGATKCVPLPVAGAFHSPLMEPAAAELRRELEGCAVRDPGIPVLANVTGKPVASAAAIRDCLGRQITAPVLWEATMKQALADGYDTFVELGPGRTLTGIVRKMDRNVKALSAQDPDSVAAMCGELGR